jgi:hypothetical protein
MTTQMNPWKVTTIAIAVIGVTALLTTYVVGQRGDSTKDSPEPVKQRNVNSSASNGAAASNRNVQAHVAECNRVAADSGDSKTMEILKDGGIGALGGAAVGAGGGAIAGGGSGAGKGAAIGGLVGAVGGALYGMNENKKNDERYRQVYASCMKSHGYQ